MKSLLTMSLLLVLAGCGSDSIQGLRGDKGEPGLGANGSDGVDGQNGNNGSNGLTPLLKLERSNSGIDPLVCTSTSGVIIKSGLDTNRDGILSIPETTQVQVVCDGEAGAQGPQGSAGTSAPQLQVTSIIDPCGDASGVQDEVFERLANGQILVLYADNANGNNPRLALLQPGNYVTSDGTNCAFSISNSMVLTDGHGTIFNP